MFPRVARSRDGVCNLGFALGYVLGRRVLSLMFQSVEGLLVHLETRCRFSRRPRQARIVLGATLQVEAASIGGPNPSFEKASPSSPQS